MGVSERGDTSVEAELLGQNLLHSFSLDGVELGVVRALSDDDDGLALSNITMLQQIVRTIRVLYGR